MAEDGEQPEPLKHFTGGVQSFRKKLNAGVDRVNSHDVRIGELEKAVKQTTPIILTLCDAGEIAAFEIQGMRITGQSET